jgi:hypothetical protein
MATQEHLLTKRARILRDIAAVRVAAASLSKLLAEDVLVGDAWERAVTVLARYRAERTRLAKELRTIDSAIGLIQLVTASWDASGGLSRGRSWSSLLTARNSRAYRTLLASRRRRPLGMDVSDENGLSV